MLNEWGMCHKASLLDRLPPTTVNPPPRINSEPVRVVANNPISPMPLPNGDHPNPSHLETPLALTPPMEINAPPTKTSVPETAAAIIDPAPFTPPCKDSHATPFHFATFLAFTVPASLKSSGLHKVLPQPQPALARSHSGPVAPDKILTPSPRADQFVPFHLAMFVAAAPLAELNLPPMYTSWPDAAMA